MCEERRAFFQKVSLMGDEPKATISINPTLWQWWVWFAGTLVAIVLGLWTGVSWVSARVFDERLNEFHKTAQPAIQQIIKEEVANHATQPAHGDVLTRLREVERENAAEAVQNAALDKRLDRIENKLDIIIRNGSKK
jgi:hypothetical protein